MRTEADQEIKTLLDSGATANFINSRTVQKLQLPIEKLDHPISVTTIDGSAIRSGKIYTQVTLTFPMNNRAFQESFLISNIGKREAVLGTPFLNKHNPAIDWRNSEVTFPFVEVQATEVPMEGLPAVYQDYASVFGDNFYSMLPPHQPHNLAINLQEGT